VQATIVAPVVTPASHQLADELGRDAIAATVTSADVLRQPAEQRVYVFCCDAALGVVLAPRIVEWGAGRAGLIGVLADGGSEEREALLEAGFDDVVAGRVSVRELSARIRSVDRRLAGRLRNGRLRHGGFTLDLLHRALWTQGKTISLTSTELEVMRALMMAAGRPLSRIDLLDAVWGGAELDVSERAVDNVILRLRRKLPQPDAIETIRGVGFRLG
jgi:DNA-binding response OmpR family regulator